MPTILKSIQLVYEAETEVLVARFSTPPTAGRKYLINETIKQLKVYGIWDKLDCLWITAAADSQAARLNWKSTDNTLTAVNSPTFTADKGYTSNGTTSYLNTNYNAATQGINFLQDSASVGVYSRSSVSLDGNVDLGWRDSGTNGVNINSRNSTGFLGEGLNSSTAGNRIATTTSIGFNSLVRNNSVNHQAYKNGAVIGTATATSNTVVSQNCYILTSNQNGTPGNFSNRQISMAFAGSGTIDQLAFYNIIQNYMNQVGANV